MKIFANFISSLIVAAWVSAIAVLAIQNIQLVSLKFLVWRSIPFHIGVLLAFCAAVGFVAGSLVPVLWQKK